MSHEETKAELEWLKIEIGKHNEISELFMATAMFLNKDIERISKEMDNPQLTPEQVDTLLQELRCIEAKFQCEKRMLAEDDKRLDILKKRFSEL
jgi:uncharacterized coiled-coil DUF342 family protein